MEEYIRKNFLTFDPVVFIETTCLNASRESTATQFEEVIDKLAADETQPLNLKSWCQRIKDCNYEILNNEETTAYWLLRNDTLKTLNTRLWRSDLRIQAVKRAAIASTAVGRKTAIISRMKRRYEETALKSERDSLVFAGTTVGTTLKNHGERQLPKYIELNHKEKHVVSMCLNSIIDLSDESKDSQRRFFSDKQWEEIKKKYSTKVKYENSNSYDEKLKKINKSLRKLDIDDGYKKARAAEVENLNGEDESLYSIYAHVINIYRKRSAALKDSKSSNTELDCLVKFWSEIIESLFPDNKSRIYCKWGESKAFHNGFRIDCRIIIKKEEDEIDLMDVEAARYFYQQKSNNDHLKLCIESKDIVDYLATYSTTFNPKKVLVFMLQICQNRCEIKHLHLCDDGLYCLESYASLSLPFSVVDFAKQSSSWFNALFSLKKNCEKLAQRFNDFDKRKDYATHFNRQTKKKPVPDYKTWVRGSFYPPAENILPISPENLYGADESKKQKNQ